MDKYYDTKVVQIGCNKHCVYCGKVAINTFEYDHYDRDDYFHCDCDGANAERELAIEIRKLRDKFASRMKEDINKINELKFNYDVQLLKNKYRIK